MKRNATNTRQAIATLIHHGASESISRILSLLFGNSILRFA
jgi:hypothetical protein